MDRSIASSILDEIVQGIVNHKSPTFNPHSPSPRRLINDAIPEHFCIAVQKITSREEKHIISQVKSVNQRENGSCGYYSLYSALHAIHIAHAQEDHHSKDYVLHMNERVGFWKSYTRLTRTLKGHAKLKGGSHYPWTLDHIEKGILERPYINFLLNNSHLLKQIWGDNFRDEDLPENTFDTPSLPITPLPDFAFNSLRNNRLPVWIVQSLSEIFRNFQTQPSYFHIFIVGLTLHWLIIVCNKVEGKLEVVMIDSRNHNLMSTEEEMRKIAEEAIRDNKVVDLEEDPFHLHPPLFDQYFSSLVEPIQIANLFCKCALGEENIETFLLEMNVGCFLDSFMNFVTGSENPDFDITSGASANTNVDLTGFMDEFDSENTIVLTKILYWLASYWPPPVIRNIVIKSLLECGIGCLTPKTKKRFAQWARYINNKINFNECNLSVLISFKTVVSWFAEKFRAF